MLPILYSFRRCPYAMRARLALAVSGTQCELREVVLRDKPAELLQASPKGTVPVLVLADGRILEQSLDIMLWALSRHDPQGWLAPEVGELEQMLALIGECDGGFKHDLDRYKYPDRYEGADAMSHRESAWQWLKMLDDRLAYSAYLFGERPALADAAIMP
ncbi:MAG: glutathione S-transferase N-terminal domain-containing protein, partial [Burkholderiaceae bacterium]